MTAPHVGRTIHSVVYIDLLPEQQDDGTDLLLGFLREAADDDSLRSIRLLRQFDPTNHFILEYVVDGAPEYDAHQGHAYVRRFRNDLHPLLGSPWDERTAKELTLPGEPVETGLP